MPKKGLRKTLPKDLDDLFDAAARSGDDSRVRAALEACEPDARGGYGQQTALMSNRCTPAIARFLVERGADVDATDMWGRTALHCSAFARFDHALPPEVLVALGADVHCRSNDGLTPLHSAADGKNLASATVLLAHGADSSALTSDGLTPLEYGLVRMSNSDLEAMALFAEAMLAAGAQVTPRAQSAVREAAETFEFYRHDFASDSVDEASAASAALCSMFGVPPPPRRVVHAGAEPIVVTGANWQEQHNQLWDLLVPGSGPCKTVQGEVIRITGRIANELRGNGGINWDLDFDAMVHALGVHLASGSALPEAELADLRTAQAELLENDDAIDRVSELAVAWVTKNPQPRTLKKPKYKR